MTCPTHPHPVPPSGHHCNWSLAGHENYAAQVPRAQTMDEGINGANPNSIRDLPVRKIG